MQLTSILTLVSFVAALRPPRLRARTRLHAHRGGKDADPIAAVADARGRADIGRVDSGAPAHVVDEGAGGEAYLASLEDELETVSSKLAAVERKIGTLAAQKKALLARQRALTNVYDEVRFEVRNARLNGPILATALAAALAAALWKDVAAIASLYENDAFMEADWLPEAARLLLRLPVDLLEDYGAAALAAPVLTKALTSCASYLFGDLTAQAVEGRRRPGLLDLPRAARNGLLGFALHGPALHFWVLFLERGPLAGALPEGPVLLLVKVALDQTAFAVFINAAYAALDGVLSDLSPSDALRRARQVLVPSVVQSWRFWPLVHLVSYSPLIPLDFKILWIDVMEIIWVAILSSTVNASEERTVPWGEGRFAEPVEDGEPP